MKRGRPPGPFGPYRKKHKPYMPLENMQVNCISNECVVVAFPIPDKVVLIRLWPEITASVWSVDELYEAVLKEKERRAQTAQASVPGENFIAGLA